MGPPSAKFRHLADLPAEIHTMRPIRDMWFIQIEVTNACHMHCADCTRFVGHHKKPFFMDLPMIEKAIDSLAG